MTSIQPDGPFRPQLSHVDSRVRAGRIAIARAKMPQLVATCPVVGAQNRKAVGAYSDDLSGSEDRKPKG